MDVSAERVANKQPVTKSDHTKCQMFKLPFHLNVAEHFDKAANGLSWNRKITSNYMPSFFCASTSERGGVRPHEFNCRSRHDFVTGRRLNDLLLKINH